MNDDGQVLGSPRGERIRNLEGKDMYAPWLGD